MVLHLAGGIRLGRDSEGVRLPDAQAREAEEEVLARLPRLLLEVEVQANDHIVALTNDLNIGHATAEANAALLASEVKVDSPAESRTLINADQDQTCHHPAPEFVPVAPASANVEDRSDRVCNLEELVAGPTDDTLHAENSQEGDQACSHAAKDGVHVGEE